MIRTIASFAFLVLLPLCACQKSDKLTESEKNAIRDNVRQALHDYYEAIRTGGMRGEFGYLDNSPDFFWVPPGYSSWIAYDSVATVLNSNAPAFRLIENVWDTLRIDPLTRDYATYTGKFHSTMTDTAGNITTVAGIETGVVIKRQDGWKLLRGQTALLPESR